MHLTHVTGSESRKPVTEDHLGHHPIDTKGPESANLGTEVGSWMRSRAGAGGRKLGGGRDGTTENKDCGIDEMSSSGNCKCRKPKDVCTADRRTPWYMSDTP